MNVANNAFALDMYRELKNLFGDNKNIFFSPASIYSALSMIYSGSQSNTAEQMKNVLRIQGGPVEKDHHIEGKKIWQQLESSLKAGANLEAANGIWVEKNYPLKTQFLEILHEFYSADPKLVDFANHSTDVVAEINKWVNLKTHGKIKNILSGDIVTHDTRIILVNAIYFKGYWKKKFKKSITSPMTFYSPNGSKVEVPMMYQKEKFIYIEDPALKSKILYVPYTGCSVTMVIILPDEVNGLQHLPSDINTENLKLSKWSEVTPREVEVYLPRFTFDLQTSLKENLQHLGVIDLFSTCGADLGGMSDSNDLYVSDVIHKAFVEVNEEGTEAAAATAAVITRRCAVISRPFVFRADHPFIFFIYDIKQNLILFSGSLSSPQF